MTRAPPAGLTGSLGLRIFVATMGIIDRFFGTKRPAEPPPWSGRPSIYAHLREHLGPGDAGLDPSGQSLPDEQEVGSDRLRWAAGALDGVLSHHMGLREDTEEQIQTLLQALRTAARSPGSDDGLTELYKLLCDGQALPIVDALAERIVKEKVLAPAALYSIARRLVEVAADREPLKIAISLLSLVAVPEDEELLVTVGAHDEFALFAGVALLRSQPDPAPALWRLARRVNGWGRIQLVEQLARLEELPEALRDWLLCEGYRNYVMVEYTALPCAQAGRLHEALARESVGDALLDGAGEILSALLTTGGPAGTLDDYEEGAGALRAYLAHIERRSARLRDFTVIATLCDWLAEEEGWAERAARGFGAEQREELQARCAAFLARPEWPMLVKEGLQSADAQLFHQADSVGNSLGIDTWDQHFARLVGGNRSHYFAAMKTRDPERIERVLRHAERDLDLETIASGPSLDLGLGPEFAQHGALDFILQELGRLPGRGWPFLRAGLRSRTVRNRNLALAALGAWSRDVWPPEALPLLSQARAEEPDEGVRGRIDGLLQEKPIET